MYQNLQCIFEDEVDKEAYRQMDNYVKEGGTHTPDEIAHMTEKDKMRLGRVLSE